MSTSDMFRPRFHFTPPGMWMNDPNGLVYYKDEYHLFYQHHPASPVWGPMHWGHAVSLDLVHWRHLPIALFPDEDGMIFSGCAVVDWGNTAGFGREALVAIYTCHKDTKETQNLAFSTDQGRTWTKYSGNPVIPAPTPSTDSRDPKVFWHRDHWVMSLATGKEITFHASPDLKNWVRTGRFGHGFGSQGGVWETPDLFQLPVDGRRDTRWILTVSVGSGAPVGGSGTQYFIGDFNGGTFVSENPRELILWADYGADFYAPQSWSDDPNDRRLMIGWMNNWQYANLLPTQGWRGSLSAIRDLSLIHTQDGIRLRQKPIPELQRLRGRHLRWKEQVVRSGNRLLEGIHSQALEITSLFQLTENVECLGFRIHQGRDEYTLVGYKPGERILFVDRTQSGAVDFSEGFGMRHSAELPHSDGTLRLQILVDSSSVEVFAADGLVVMTECVFPTESHHGLDFFIEGGPVLLQSMDIYYLDPATFLKEGV